MAGKGVVVKWERLRRQNHWLDALYNGCAAGHLAGVRLVDEAAPPPPPARPQGVRDADRVSDAFMERLRLKEYPGWLSGG